MKSIQQKFAQVKEQNPVPRGYAFESLINEIFQSEETLISPSFRTVDTEQQIDGAVEVKGRVFLLEVKWENSETIAASKLFSFIGKVNSKIEGTLGVFISYTRLSDNVLSAIRNGLRQNVLLVHGERNIEDLIRRNVNWSEFIWYTFQKASTSHVVYVDYSDFAAQITDSSKTKIDNTIWEGIFSCIKDETKSTAELIAKISPLKQKIADYSDYAIEVYPHLSSTLQIQKLSLLLDKMQTSNPSKFSSVIQDAIGAAEWRKYATEAFSDKYIKSATFDDHFLLELTTRLCKIFDETGDYDIENEVTYVLKNIFDKVNDEAKRRIFETYTPIFIDTYRKSHFPQKQFANDIFKESNKKNIATAFKSYIQQEITKSEARYFDDDDAIKARVRCIATIEYKARSIINIVGETVIDEFKNLDE